IENFLAHFYASNFVNRLFLQRSQVQTHRLQVALRTHFVISNVPSTPASLRGRQLEGKLILEVPAQVNPIPQSVLRA
ncbi:hypothetical protein, partial [Neisseria meningitidis]|uniref:hypothetical protein n=1 Tax=Neisseria meningitidis TaxID=487 RepID=UPI00288AD9A1